MFGICFNCYFSINKNVFEDRISAEKKARENSICDEITYDEIYNCFGFDYSLNKGESFITPEAIMIVNKSSDGLIFEMHNKKKKKKK